jgi:hypothetical protein
MRKKHIPKKSPQRAKRAPAKPQSAQKADTGKAYDAKTCAKVLKLGREGKSPAQIRAALNITSKHWSSWIRHHADFAEAAAEAQSLALAHWEAIGHTGVSMGVRFNAHAYVFIMKNRFSDHYTDRQDVNVSGKGLAPVHLVVSPAEAAL